MVFPYDNAGLPIFTGPDLKFPERAQYSTSLLIASSNPHCHYANAFGLPVLGNSFPKRSLAFLLSTATRGFLCGDVTAWNQLLSRK